MKERVYTSKALDRLPLLLSLSEFARWLGVSRSSVMQMRRRGEIATVKVAKRHRYPKWELQRLANTKQSTAESTDEYERRSDPGQ
jgi:hypothetical protein